MRPDMQLKLPINRSNLDIGCDQGYGSERSPEDELPPPLPLGTITYQPEIHEPPWDYDKFNGCEYRFITKGNNTLYQLNINVIQLLRSFLYSIFL